MNKQVQQGINVLLKVDNTPVGGQLNVALNRSNNSIDITNKINGDWVESLPGLKTWSINCSGIYIRNQEGFNLLEEAFMNNQEIEAEINISGYKYKGNCFITDFPVNSVYNQQFKYTVKLLGNGELQKQ